MVKRHQNQKIKQTHNQTQTTTTTTATTTTTTTISRKYQFLIISTSIIKSIFFLITINLSLVVSNISLNPIFGQTLNEFYQFEFHQFIDFFIIPIFLYCSKTSILNQNFTKDLSVIYFFTLAILIQRLPKLYSICLDFFGFGLNGLGYLFRPLGVVVIGFLPIRLFGFVLGILDLESVLSDQRWFKNQNQNKSTSFVWISIFCLVFHSILSFSLNSLSKLILSNIQPCEIFPISSITFLIFSILTTLSGFLTQRNSNLKNTLFKTIIILIIYKSFPPPQSLCNNEPSLETKSKTSLLARRISTTGLITVGEFQDPESQEVFRYLRSDHSLLGGIWIGPAMKSITNKSDFQTKDQIEHQAIKISESIYSTFIIQEAIRLVIRNPHHNHQQEEALIIGLGIGVSSKSLMTHSIKITVVEIDPIVYEYALKYFGMIQPDGGIHLEDIRVYLDRERMDEGVLGRFDYVIHDVFTGGMVPAELFVKTFWVSLKNVLKFDGVLVINFAGLPTSNAGLMVLFTIFDVFPYCRTFSEKSNQDQLQDSEELEFQNLVIFCKMNEVPSFRKVTPSDVSNSKHKYWTLNQLMNHELTSRISSILKTHSSLKEKMILKDETDSIRLKDAQVESALNHWNVMRDLLDRKTWENYY